MARGAEGRGPVSGEEWERRTGTPQGLCAACGAKFAAGDAYVAALFVREGKVVREDRCAKCASPETPPEALGQWRAKVAAPKGPAVRRLDFDTLAELFPRLDGREDDASKRLRWIVALLLVRKKILQQLSRETRDGVEMLALKFKHDDRVYRVTDPRMDEAATAQLHEELGKLFELDAPK